MPGQRSGSVTPAIVSDSALAAAQYGFTCCARTMLFVNVAELGLLLAAVVLPVLLGMVSALMRRLWWWAAIVAVVVAMVAAIAPTPEPGEARLVAGGRSVPAHPGRRSGWAGVVGVVPDTPLAAPQCRPSWSGAKAELDIVICPEPRT
jgi:hypothetical protein